MTALFGAMPVGTGTAFVVVQHLAPDQPSLLPELLQRATPLRVVEASDGAPLRADCIFVIPPAHLLTVEDGVLRLDVPIDLNECHHAVDVLFESLSIDQGANAAGVILSGMGSDGVKGMIAIKKAAGLTLVQEPASAEADSMPLSALDAGVVDLAAPADALALQILRWQGGRSIPAASARHVSGEDDREGVLRHITELVKERCGNDFLHYKRGTLRRRVERRMVLHQLQTWGEYLTYMRSNPPELDLLFKELLIGVTSFFRDAEVWEGMRRELLPAMLARHPDGHGFRAWVPACSSGEEAYTLAMAFREAVDDLRHGPRHTLQIFATDLDPDAVARARKGLYPKDLVARLGQERLSRFFVAEGDHYRVVKEVRDMVVFAQQNVTSDPPFTKLDVLSCRNLLIYFGAALQRRLMPLFHYALHGGGLLVLGNAETVGQSSISSPPLPASLTSTIASTRPSR